jgi:hypothetical protein
MGVAPHALSSSLLHDLSEAIDRPALDRIKSGSGMWPGISFKEAACWSLYNSLLKKLETGMTNDTKAAALKKFLKVDSDCKNWELQFTKFGDDLLFGQFRDYLNKFGFQNFTLLLTMTMTSSHEDGSVRVLR